MNYSPMFTTKSGQNLWEGNVIAHDSKVSDGFVLNKTQLSYIPSSPIAFSILTTQLSIKIL